MKDMTIKMKENPGVVETITGMLNHIQVDGETMEYIICQVGMEEQMLRQLLLKADTEMLNQLIEEKEIVVY